MFDFDPVMRCRQRSNVCLHIMTRYVNVFWRIDLCRGRLVENIFQNNNPETVQRAKHTQNRTKRTEEKGSTRMSSPSRWKSANNV